MFTCSWMFRIVLLGAVAAPARASAPRLSHYTCEEFELGASFNPYEAIESLWKIIYSWAGTTEINPIVFNIPVREPLKKFRAVVDAVYPDQGIEWNKATLFMEPRPGTLILLLYDGTPGAFRAVVKKEHMKDERPRRPPLIMFADVRLKIVDQYLGMMCCEDHSAYVMARVDELPRTEEDCVRAAATLGFQGPGGRSYLYLQNLTRRQLDEL